MIGDIQYFCDIKVLGAVIFSVLLTGVEERSDMDHRVALVCSLTQCTCDESNQGALPAAIPAYDSDAGTRVDAQCDVLQHLHRQSARPHSHAAQSQGSWASVLQ